MVSPTMIMKEIFLFNDGETPLNLYGVSQNQAYQMNKPTGKESKNYFRCYIKYAQQLGIKVKSFNFNLCAPVITKEALEFANYLNLGIKTIGGINININLFTLEQLINEIIKNISAEYWYITQAPPCIADSKKEVLSLTAASQALLI